MRHTNKGRILGRNPTHRAAMFRNMACSLFAHERIITTQAKAKELRPYVEKLITLGKRGAAHLEAAGGSGDEARVAKSKVLHYRRMIMSRLGGRKVVPIKDGSVNVADKLITDIGVRFKDRQGGYTRIIKSAKRRLGDAALTAVIELLGAGERKAAKEAPAPAVSES